jgi:rhamnosyltransferase
LVLKRLAIAFFFDEAGIVDDYMLHLVKEIGRFVERTIFVANGPLNVNSELAVRELVDELLIRQNTDFDVGAYKAALEKLGFDRLRQYDEIIL